MAQQSSGPDGKYDTVTKTETVNVASPRNFWKTNGCAVLITAFGGVIASIVTGTATFLAAQNDDKKSPEPAAMSPKETVTVTVEKPAGGGTPQLPPAAGADPDVRWSGRFNLTSYPDFESVPPKNNNLGKGNYEYLTMGYGEFKVNGSGSSWTSPERPTKKQCSDLIDTQYQDKIPVNSGTQFCYRTGMGTIVFIKVVGSTTESYQTEVLIWNR